MLFVIFRVLVALGVSGKRRDSGIRRPPQVLSLMLLSGVKPVFFVSLFWYVLLLFAYIPLPLGWCED